MKNPIRAALARGDTVTGIILFTGSPMITELAAAAGIDSHADDGDAADALAIAICHAHSAGPARLRLRT
jgi:2-keto-3-deoxy-L-rhamnonate aldolase RhmA